MMTWKIRYTDKARRDLRNIMEYVSYDLLEPETASHPAAFSHTLAGWLVFIPMFLPGIVSYRTQSHSRGPSHSHPQILSHIAGLRFGQGPLRNP